MRKAQRYSALPPGLSMLPVTAMRSATASVTPSAAICCSKARPHWQAQLDDVAMRRAAPRSASASTSQMGAAHSGVLSATRSASASKP